MSMEKIKKETEAIQEEKKQDAGFSAELSDDDLDAVAGGMETMANRNYTIPKDSKR